MFVITNTITDLSNSTMTRSIATMSISGLYEAASAVSSEMGGVSFFTAVLDRPNTKATTKIRYSSPK